jgi:hypothetical protein
MAGPEGNRIADEDSKLKDAVQIHGGKKGDAISALVPGRTRLQCRSRWHDTLIPNIALAARRTGKWAEEEDSKAEGCGTNARR